MPIAVNIVYVARAQLATRCRTFSSLAVSDPFPLHAAGRLRRGCLTSNNQRRQLSKATLRAMLATNQSDYDARALHGP